MTESVRLSNFTVKYTKMYSRMVKMVTYTSLLAILNDNVHIHIYIIYVYGLHALFNMQHVKILQMVR